jgi:hypothetical protein
VGPRWVPTAIDRRDPNSDRSKPTDVPCQGQRLSYLIANGAEDEEKVRNAGDDDFAVGSTLGTGNLISQLPTVELVFWEIAIFATPPDVHHCTNSAAK